MLVRRNRRSGEFAFYRCFSPRSLPLSELVSVAGRRWTVEETLPSRQDLAGLDEHQVRRRTSWHRWVTLAMLAHAFLAVAATAERRDHPAPTTWSQWRRRHQAQARNCHYRRQAAAQL